MLLNKNQKIVDFLRDFIPDFRPVEMKLQTQDF